MNPSDPSTQIAALAPEQLVRRTDPQALGFTTTDEVPESPGIVGQARAMDAIRFGIGIDRKGYNLFVLGPPGIGKHTLLLQYLEQRAADAAVPLDLCYVHNFVVPHQPTALELPAGLGAQLRRDMQLLGQEIRPALAAAFESEEFRTRSRVIEQSFKSRQEAAFNGLQAQAGEHQLVMLNTPMGLAFAPRQGEDVVEPAAFQKLPEAERQRFQADIATMGEALRDVLVQAPRWERESREELRALARELCSFTINGLMADERERYADQPNILAFLDAVLADIVDNVQHFAPLGGRPEESSDRPEGDGGALTRRYQVNLLVDHTNSQGAPVIYEDNPTFVNLVGRVEYRPEMGALVTDVSLIKPGALHRANGGYLVLDAAKLLLQPLSWEALKRALYAHQVRIESPAQLASVVSTISLEPEPTPLDLKVALIGNRELYYLLSSADPDFGELFKVAADFEDDTVRSPEAVRAYGRLLAGIVRREALRPFDAAAIARAAEDSERLSTAIHPLGDLLFEADHWAGQRNADTVEATDVAQALAAGRRRESRVADRLHEQILRETVLVDTDGLATGQVNGLSVLQLGSRRFGQPSRITARVWLGRGEVVDIEREANLGGPIHAKGVLILTGFLSGRYARERPLSLSASLVFEQNYGGVEGDSASAAELYALLSAIADVPIRQSIAVTGSVNQLGMVQAIGGVNEKIEGFFDICQARGLTGRQGVIIPAANIKHLMLRPDVVTAAEQGQFQVWAIRRIDDGVPILMGLEAGTVDEAGSYPADSLNGRVATRLADMASRRRAFGDLVADAVGEP
jgi:predicted ATP-dependent protease